MVDHRGGLRRAIERLAQLGHRRIAWITGSETLFPARERIAGYLSAHEALRLSVDNFLIRTGSFQVEFGFEQSSLLVSSTDPPTAIFAGGIDIRPGILKAFRLKGRVIPRDISIVGTLNSDLVELHDPPISVISWNYGDIGRIAARFALERLRGAFAVAPKRLTIPTGLIMR